MSEKLNGYLICPVSGLKHKDGILKDDQGSTGPDRDVSDVVGLGYAPEIQKKFDEGYVCLAEVTSEIEGENVEIESKDALRTGVTCFVKRELAEDMFGPDADIKEFQFVSSGVINFLKGIKDGDDFDEDFSYKRLDGEEEHQE